MSKTKLTHKDVVTINSMLDRLILCNSWFNGYLSGEQRKIMERTIKDGSKVYDRLVKIYKEQEAEN